MKKRILLRETSGHHCATFSASFWKSVDGFFLTSPFGIFFTVHKGLTCFYAFLYYFFIYKDRFFHILHDDVLWVLGVIRHHFQLPWHKLKTDFLYSKETQSLHTPPYKTNEADTIKDNEPNTTEHTISTNHKNKIKTYSGHTPHTYHPKSITHKGIPQRNVENKSLN